MNRIAAAALAGLLLAVLLPTQALDSLRSAAIPAASAQTAPCVDRISVQDQYALLKAKNDLYFHRTIHRLNINDWYSINDNKPWGNTPITDIDMTETPKALAAPTIPVAVVSAGSDVFIHYNLLDQANRNWQSLNANKPWGDATVTNVGISGHPSNASIRVVVSAGNSIYFLWSQAYGNPYGSYVWANVSDNRPWGANVIKDVDVNNFNGGLVLAANQVHVHQALQAPGANNWKYVNQAGAAPVASERGDMEFRPTILSKGSDVRYIKYPFPGYALAWGNISDNKPWGTAHVDDVSVFFWTQAEPWQTPAIAMIVAGDKPYLHWHPDNVAFAGVNGNWLDSSDNAPWAVAGGPCAQTGTQTNLSVVKTGPAAVTRGGIVTYSLAVSNAGPAAATNVVAVDTPPAGFVFVPASSDALCHATGDNVICSIPALGVNETRTLAVSFTVPNPAACTTQTVTNTATVESTNDPAMANNTSAIQTTLNCPQGNANLSVVKTGPATAIRGTSVSYDLVVANAGPDAATNVTVTDTPPADLTYTQATGDGTCTLAGGVVTCAMGSIASGQSKTVRLTFMVGGVAGAACLPANVTNAATVRADQNDATTSNNQSTAALSVSCPPVAADLTVVKAAPAEAVRGTQVQYQLTVINGGLGAAENVTLTDATPAGLEYLSSDGQCAVQGGNVVCQLGSINAGNAKTVTLTFRFIATAQACSPSSIQNRATVTTVSAETDTTNNASATVTTQVTCTAIPQCRDNVDNDNDGAIDFPSDFSCSSAEDNDETLPKAQCQDQADNDGDGKTDAQDPGCHFDGNPGNPASYNPQDNNEFDGGSSASSSSSALPQCRDGQDNDGDGAIDHPSDFSCSGPDDNDETLPMPQCNDGADNDADTRIDEDDAGCHWDGNPGNPNSYNPQDNDESNPAASSSSAASVPQCRDNVDNDGDGAIDFPSDFSCSHPDDTDETLPKAQCQDQLDNDGDTKADAQDPGCHVDGNASNSATYNPQDNDEFNQAASSSASSVSSSGTLGCIEVRTETVDPQGVVVTPVAQFTSVLDGGQTTVNDSAGIARFNNVAAGAHTVSQQLPSAWTLQSVSPVGGVVAVSAGSSCAQVTFRNRQVLSIPSFQVTKTDGRTTAKAGEILSYTITVTNVSQSPAAGVTVTDVLPIELQFLSASDGPQAAGQQITWNGLSIPAGTSRTLTVQARVRDGVPTGTVMRNTAQVTGPATATGEDTTIVEGRNSSVGSCDVEVTLDTDEDEVEPGGEITYTITVENNTGDDDEFEVTLALPDEVKFQDADEDGEEDDGTVEWSVDIDDGDEIELTATVEVDEDEVDDGDELDAVAIVDCATDETTTDVEGDGNDDDDDDDNDDEELSVSKDANPSEVFPGGTVEYTVTVENNGDTTLKDIEVEDHLSGSNFSIIDDGDADSRSGNTLKWKIKELKKGKTKIFRYRILVDNAAYPGATVSNNVTVENDDTDDSANVTVTVIGSLPQTGFGIRGNGSNSHLTPVKTGEDTGNGPVLAGLLAVLSGAGAGIGLMRRRFLSL